MKPCELTKRTGEMANLTVAEDPMLEISALSRPIYLGMLYNACNDQIIPGDSLWPSREINSQTQISSQPTSGFQVAASESLKEKTGLLDMSASVKASFYCGLVDVGGSASYLKEKTSSFRQCRVALKYHVSTVFKQLMISELGIPKPEILNTTDATHVVCGVLYGANALMEFQETATSDSQKQQIEGNLNVMINKIPKMEISGDGRLKMDVTDMEKVKNFSCRFFGDFHLKEFPSTYAEAVKDLPGLMSEVGESAVPVKVWLYPLSKFNNIKSKFKHMISETLVSDLEKVLDDVHRAEIRTKDLLETSKHIKADDIVCKLEQFQKHLADFTSEFKHKMADLIPAIRVGSKEEMALKDLLKAQDASGFSVKDMELWLDGKSMELDIIQRNIKKLDCKIKALGRELDSFLMDPDTSDAFVFCFTSLNYEEQYLKKIAQATESIKNSSPCSTSSTLEQEDLPWYKRTDIKEAINSAVIVYNNPHKLLTSIKKAISFFSDPKHPGASIRWYRHNTLKDPHVTCINLQLFACHLTMDPDTVNTKLLLSEGNRKATFVKSAQTYPEHPQRFDHWPLVLSQEPLPVRCYWECECGILAYVGIAYKNMERIGRWNSSGLGHNDKSWSLIVGDFYTAIHNNKEHHISSGAVSRRVVVFLDREAGILSFHSVSANTLTHITTFHPTFTDEPLHAGFGIGHTILYWIPYLLLWHDSSVSLC